jgi:anti-anti-sigma factor
MRIEQSSHQGCVVLTLGGRLEVAAAPQLQRAILKQLADHPPAIICELGQVEAIDPLCAGVFTAIQHPALSWPGTSLVLCGARPAVAGVLARHGLADRLAMYPDLDQALGSAHHRPPMLSERLALGPVPTAVGAGRAFVRDVCDRWGLQELAGSAELLASELITNAVVHARTAMELRVELRGPQLHLAVKDQDPNLARVLAAKERAGRELGLGIERVATAWGCARRGLAARSSGAPWTCHHRTPTQRTATCSRRPIPASPP